MNASDIGYLNALCTVSEAGDVVKTNAIKLAFQDLVSRLAISSTKAVHGHAMGAEGAREFVASVMSLRSGQLPPTAFFKRLTSAVYPDCIRLLAHSVKKVRAVMSNSFAFGGSNAVPVAKPF